MLIPVSVMPIPQIRSSVVGFCDSIYPNLIKCLLLVTVTSCAELIVQFPARGSTEVLSYAFFLGCCGCDTSYIMTVHIQCQTSIYTLSLCRGHSWRVRLAKQETLTSPRHLVSPLVCRGP